MPVDNNIYLPEKARKRIEDIVQNIEDLQSMASSYLDGVAAALEVPEGYTFDQKSLAFVAPPKPEAVPRVSTPVLNGVPEAEDLVHVSNNGVEIAE